MNADLDPDPATQINADPDPDTDPDPKPCLQKYILIYAFCDIATTITRWTTCLKGFSIRKLLTEIVVITPLILNDLHSSW